MMLRFTVLSTLLLAYATVGFAFFHARSVRRSSNPLPTKLSMSYEDEIGALPPVRDPFPISTPSLAPRPALAPQCDTQCLTSDGSCIFFLLKIGAILGPFGVVEGH